MEFDAPCLEADNATTTPSSGSCIPSVSTSTTSRGGDVDRPGDVDFHPWPAVLDACAQHFQQVSRLSTDALEALREDGTTALPCLLLEPRPNKSFNIEFRVVFATRSMGRALGRSCSSLTAMPGHSFLQVQPPAVDAALNQKAWAHLSKLQAEFQRCSSTTLPSPTRVLLLCSAAHGTPCWNLLEAVPVRLSTDTDTGGRYILYMLHPLEAPVPKGLFGPSALANEECIKLSVSRLRTNVSSKQVKGTDGYGPLAEMAKHTITILQEVLKDSQVGDLFVPRLGLEAVAAFRSQNMWGRVFAKVKDSLTYFFEMSTAELQSLADDSDGKSKRFACAVARVNEAECSLVHVSRGFTALSGFTKEWVLGRNCRFLQPHDAQKNQAFNSTELKRMKHFCQKLRGRMLTVLLQETSDGTPFWNLLHMDHVNVDATSYIVSAQTLLEAEQNILERVVESMWSTSGPAALEGLRAILARKEGALAERCTMRRIAVEAFQEWLAEAGSGVDGWWQGSSFIPQIGEFAVQEFAKQWPNPPDKATKGIREVLEQHVGLCRDLDGAGCYAISKPHSVDCPLVYVCPAFEACTGYPAEFALGRNCRFMQPRLRGLNEAINKEEIQYVSQFVRDVQVDRSTPALLLNERRNGKRFWNLLYLRHVELKGQRYILGAQRPLGISMPAVLESHEASAAVMEYDGQALASFVDLFGPCLSSLRKELHQNFSSDVVGALAKATSSLISGMKTCCDEYEGDHRVPRMGGRELEIFESDEMWKSIIDVVGASLMQVCGVDVTNGQCSSWSVPCAVADASTPDAALVFVSKEFELLTGYSREWVIGRNCRFLQPNHVSVNTALNRQQLKELREWVQRGEPGSRIMKLLVNEAHDEYPFWNLLFLEFLQANGRPYIFAIQNVLDCELDSLAELLGMDDLGLGELARLRKTLTGLDLAIRGKKLPLQAAVRECVGKWAKGLPPVMRVPKIPSSDCPVVCLELGGKVDFLPVISEALREGVRHFHVTFHGCDRPQSDERMAELEGRLRALRLAEALNDLKKCHLHYLRSAVCFTLVTPPLLISAFSEFSKAITSSGYVFDSWMLDVRGVALAKVQECWRTMSLAKRAREVSRLGVWGAPKQVLEALCEDAQLERPSICAVETYPGKEADIMHHNQMDFVRRLGVTIYAYHVYGPKNSVLESESVQAESMRLGVDSAILTIKWAEAKGFGVVLPRLRPGPAAEQGAEQAPGVRSRTCSSSFDGSSDVDDPGDVQGQVGMRRSFNRDYLRAPAAEHCAVVMEAAAKARAGDRPGWHSQTPRSASKRLARRATTDLELSPTAAVAAAAASLQVLTQEQGHSALPTPAPSSARRHTINANFGATATVDFGRLASERSSSKTAPRLLENGFTTDQGRISEGTSSSRVSARSTEGELPQLKRPARRQSAAATLTDLDEVEEAPPLSARSRTAQFRRPSRASLRGSVRFAAAEARAPADAGAPDAEGPPPLLAKPLAPQAATQLQAVARPLTPQRPLQGSAAAEARAPADAGAPDAEGPPLPAAKPLAPQLPLQPSAAPRPSTPQHPLQGRAAAEARTLADAAPGAEGLPEGQLPSGMELLRRAGVKLQGQGWSLQEIASLFDLPQQVVVQSLRS